MLNIFYHFRELFLRLFYALLAWLIVYAILFSYIDSLILVLTPTINTTMIYTSAIEILQARLSITLYISAFYLYPH